MSDNAWRVVFGVASAVCSFLLAQTDVTLEPIAKVALGAIVVALAVVNPNRASAATRG